MRVDKPNPVFARMLQQAIGGPEGEMRVMNQYLFQAWGARDRGARPDERGRSRRRDRRPRPRDLRLPVLRPRGRADGPRGAVAHRRLARRQGRVLVRRPGPALGQEPQLAKAPASVHGGTEATRGDGENGGEGDVMDKVKDAVGKAM